MILCICGVLVCADFGSGTNFISILYAVVAALSFSMYTVLNKKYMKKISGVIQTSLSFFLGSIVLLVVLVLAEIKVIPDFSRQNLSVLIYLGTVVTGIGYWAYFKAIEKGGAMMASFAFFIKPILTPFATFIINRIKPDAKVFLALILIVCGSYFIG